MEAISLEETSVNSYPSAGIISKEMVSFIVTTMRTYIIT
jgi:hypothetical protein